MIKFEIIGTPVPKGRPRFSRNRTYTPKRTVDYQKLIQSSCPKTEMLSGQLKATLSFYFSVPKSSSKKSKEDKLSGLVRPTKRPDCDNLAKSVLDGLNNLLYYDDSQIVTLLVYKYYGDIEKCEVVIEEV